MPKISSYKLPDEEEYTLTVGGGSKKGVRELEAVQLAALAQLDKLRRVGSPADALRVSYEIYTAPLSDHPTVNNLASLITHRKMVAQIPSFQAPKEGLLNRHARAAGEGIKEGLEAVFCHPIQTLVAGPCEIALQTIKGRMAPLFLTVGEGADGPPKVCQPLEPEAITRVAAHALTVGAVTMGVSKGLGRVPLEMPYKERIWGVPRAPGQTPLRVVDITEETRGLVAKVARVWAKKADAMCPSSEVAEASRNLCRDLGVILDRPMKVYEKGFMVLGPEGDLQGVALFSVGRNPKAPLYVNYVVSNPANLACAGRKVQGAGTLLMEKAESVAAEAEKTTIQLSAFDCARGFYEKRGYTILEIDEEYQQFVMSKSLSRK